MLARIATMLAAAALFTACAEDPDNSGEIIQPPGELAVSLQYISGHLGAYWDCPDDAMPALADRDQMARRAPGAAEAPEAGFAADCAEDSPDCGGFLNCQPAELRLRVTNDGDAALQALEILRLQLDWGDQQSDNDVVGVFDADGNVFDGALEPGESVDLRIEYRGPHPSDVDWDQGLPAIISVGEDQQSEALTTPELQMVPQVAT